jgi:hypothetical protein
MPDSEQATKYSEVPASEGKKEENVGLQTQGPNDPHERNHCDCWKYYWLGNLCGSDWSPTEHWKSQLGPYRLDCIGYIFPRGCILLCRIGMHDHSEWSRLCLHHGHFRPFLGVYSSLGGVYDCSTLLSSNCRPQIFHVHLEAILPGL